MNGSTDPCRDGYEHIHAPTLLFEGIYEWSHFLSLVSKVVYGNLSW